MHSYAGAAKAAQLLHLSRPAITQRISRNRFIPPEIVISENPSACGIHTLEDIGRVFGTKEAFTSQKVTRATRDTLGWSEEKILSYGRIEQLINADGSKNIHRTFGVGYSAVQAPIWDTQTVPARFYFSRNAAADLLKANPRQISSLVGEPDVVVVSSQTAGGWAPSRLLVIAGLVHG